METLYQILGLISAALILFILFRTIKGRPDLFSKKQLSNSFFTMGILAIILIAFVALLVLLLRSS